MLCALCWAVLGWPSRVRLQCAHVTCGVPVLGSRCCFGNWPPWGDDGCRQVLQPLGDVLSVGTGVDLRDPGTVSTRTWLTWGRG